MIEDYGAMHELPDAACQPERDLEYRLIYRISQPPNEEGNLTSGLSHIAVTINLFEWAGVPPGQMHLVGIIHGDATPAALSGEAYDRQFGRTNPDADLIHQLVQHGVRIYVCGQSVLNHGYRREDVNQEVVFALSALSVLATHQVKGYALMHY